MCIYQPILKFQANGKTLGQVLLTTCVGSVEELEEMVIMIGPVLRKTWQSVGSSSSGSGGNSATSLSGGGSIRSTSQMSGVFGMKPNLLWNAEALRTLYHFVRCSQLEYVGQEGRLPIQVSTITYRVCNYRPGQSKGFFLREIF